MVCVAIENNLGDIPMDKGCVASWNGNPNKGLVILHTLTVKNEQC